MGDNNRGNGDRAQEFTSNQVVTLQQRLQFVLGQLKTREAELTATLPPDLPFDRFHATVNQALRNNPDLLECVPISIVNACVKSAYDGLRLDGREAALVSHNVKVKVRGGADQWEKHAQYFPMVFGLIQQVLRGGMVTAIETDIIYENDYYRVLRGTMPSIEHEPLLKGDRGAPIAAYSVAVFPNGYRATNFMTRAEIEDVQAASKSGMKDGESTGIWKRWPSEMWKKTVIRRHRKTLPVGRDIVDVEARDEFAIPDRTTAHPQLAAPASSPARPTRAAIEQRGDSYGEPLDMGHTRVVDHEPTEREQQRQDPPREQQRAAAEPAEPEIELPEDMAAWGRWGIDVESKIAKANSADAVDQVWRNAQPVLKHATKEIRDRLTGKVTARNTDLALEASDAGDGATE